MRLRVKVKVRVRVRVRVRAWVMERIAASLVLRWSLPRCFLIATGSPCDGRWG